ncbi:MAG: hypothetical protein ABIP03_03150 [Aquihabitans sp.]
MSPPSTTGTHPGSPLGGLLAIVGGVLTIAGLFIPWVTNNQSDAGLSGWDLTSGDKGFIMSRGDLLTFKSLDPYFLLILGFLGIVIGLLLFTGISRSIARVVVLVAGLAIVGLLAYDWTSLSEVVSQNAPPEFEIATATGFYLSIAGGAVMAAASLMPAKKVKQAV